MLNQRTKNKQNIHIHAYLTKQESGGNDSSIKIKRTAN
jgi:hypothetical protein